MTSHFTLHTESKLVHVKVTKSPSGESLHYYEYELTFPADESETQTIFERFSEYAPKVGLLATSVEFKDDVCIVNLVSDGEHKSTEPLYWLLPPDLYDLPVTL
jgi:hypothetical protein